MVMPDLLYDTKLRWMLCIPKYIIKEIYPENIIYLDHGLPKSTSKSKNKDDANTTIVQVNDTIESKDFLLFKKYRFFIHIDLVFDIYNLRYKI